VNNIEYIATTFQGLEEVLAKEIADLGGSVTQIYTRAVGFTGDKRFLYKANLHLRTAIRILLPLARFEAISEHQLYNEVYNINWLEHLDVSQTIAVQSAINSPHFNHSQYVALKVKDAIVDKFKNKII
jgi:putative N6-adenine-specific DNA methylase